MGEGVGLMSFSGSSCELRQLDCKAALFFVVADLKAGKDTVQILRDLNACFPFPLSDQQVSLSP